MKMVKSLLLGSAAGLVAVTVGQAADLPVKAKPVEYVKVCSLYGAGFYYMPGTDLCMKVGGWARAEAGYGYNGNVTWGPFSGNVNNRNTNNMTFRARGYITADVRSQSEYGTIRGYLAVGVNTSDVGLNTASNTFSANRAFVQFAGFTGGLSQSFFDYYSVPAIGYAGAYPASDTGDPGWFVLGYTAQLGNGLSLTLADEARRTTQIINASGALSTASTGGALPGNSTAFPGAYGGQQFGDFVGNLRLDQAWGGGQIMGALHQVNANYYGSTPLTGHPSDDYGWAAGVGLRINFPEIAHGDFFEFQANVTQGALRYIFQTPNSNWSKVDGSTEAYGVLSDAVYGASPDSVHLTSAWNVNAGYDHYWLPNWHQSLYGGYAAVTYGSTANAELCTFESSSFTPAAGCNNNWSTWWLGSRLQWDVTKTFYMGVEVLYEQLNSGKTGTTSLGNLAIANSGATTVEGSSNDWLIRFRAHRDFLP